MNRLCFGVLALSLLVGGGCASEFEIHRSKVGINPLAPAASESVYVSLPADGTSGSGNTLGPGHFAANAVAAYFSKNGGSAVVGDKPETPDEGLRTAGSRRFTYCASPKVLHWEDRATEWSGKRDRASLGLIITRVSNGQVIDDAVIEGVGTWWTLGGLHPQDLLERMMEQYPIRAAAPPRTDSDVK